MEVMMEDKQLQEQKNKREPMTTLPWIAVLFFLIWINPGCEVEFIPRDINLNPELVVEGYIEAGPEALPAYVILTRSKPFFSELSLQELDNLFVRNAAVTINDGQQTTTLSELCFNDLPADLRQLAAERLGLNPDSVLINFCVYLDLASQIKPVSGKSYRLNIIAGDERIEATTTVPEFIPLDSLWWREAPGKPVDTLLQLMARVNDPVGEKNFYRYFCRINEGPFETPFSSVNDDILIDGKTFDFRLIRPRKEGEEFDQSTFGLFRTGDSITIKWTSIDEAHFKFWNTFEFNKGNQGPFSSYTTIDSNIKGGLGVWGAYASGLYRLRVAR